MDAARQGFQIYRDAGISQTLSSSVSQDGSLPVLSDDEEVHHETLKIQYFLRSATPGGRRRSIHERQPTPHVSGRGVPEVRLVINSPEHTPRPRQERLPANSADLEEGVLYTLCASPRPGSRARSALGGDGGLRITTTIEPAGGGVRGRRLRSVSPRPGQVTAVEYERTEEEIISLPRKQLEQEKHNSYERQRLKTLGKRWENKEEDEADNEEEEEREERQVRPTKSAHLSSHLPPPPPYSALKEPGSQPNTARHPHWIECKGRAEEDHSVLHSPPPPDSPKHRHWSSRSLERRSRSQEKSSRSRQRSSRSHDGRTSRSYQRSPCQQDESLSQQIHTPRSYQPSPQHESLSQQTLSRSREPSPRPRYLSSQPWEESISQEILSPRSLKASQTDEEKSPRKNNASPRQCTPSKQQCTSPKQEDTTPKQEDTTSRREDISPRRQNASSKHKDSSPRSQGASPGRQNASPRHPEPVKSILRHSENNVTFEASDESLSNASSAVSLERSPARSPAALHRPSSPRAGSRRSAAVSAMSWREEKEGKEQHEVCIELPSGETLGPLVYEVMSEDSEDDVDSVDENRNQTALKSNRSRRRMLGRFVNFERHVDDNMTKRAVHFQNLLERIHEGKLKVSVVSKVAKEKQISSGQDEKENTSDILDLQTLSRRLKRENNYLRRQLQMMRTVGQACHDAEETNDKTKGEANPEASGLESMEGLSSKAVEHSLYKMVQEYMVENEKLRRENHLLQKTRNAIESERNELLIRNDSLVQNLKKQNKRDGSPGTGQATTGKKDSNKAAEAANGVLRFPPISVAVRRAGAAKSPAENGGTSGPVTAQSLNFASAAPPGATKVVMAGYKRSHLRNPAAPRIESRRLGPFEDPQVLHHHFKDHAYYHKDCLTPRAGLEPDKKMNRLGKMEKINLKFEPAAPMEYYDVGRLYMEGPKSVYVVNKHGDISKKNSSRLDEHKIPTTEEMKLQNGRLRKELEALDDQIAHNDIAHVIDHTMARGSSRFTH